MRKGLKKHIIYCGDLTRINEYESYLRFSFELPINHLRKVFIGGTWKLEFYCFQDQFELLQKYFLNTKFDTL